MSTINLVFASDNNYAQHTAVAMTSILLNTKNPQKIKYFFSVQRKQNSISRIMRIENVILLSLLSIMEHIRVMRGSAGGGFGRWVVMLTMRPMSSPMARCASMVILCLAIVTQCAPLCG